MEDCALCLLDEASLSVARVFRVSCSVHGDGGDCRSHPRGRSCGGMGGCAISFGPDTFGGPKASEAISVPTEAHTSSEDLNSVKQHIGHVW